MTTPTTTIFFHDMSGSTCGICQYHDLSLKIYNEQVKNKNSSFENKKKLLEFSVARTITSISITIIITITHYSRMKF
jgi:hypothetical protein